jgi:hypothetical protein
MYELTFVLRVLFRTSPALMIRSNSKLPFSVTGEKGSRAVRLRCACEAECDVGLLLGMGMLCEAGAVVVDVATARFGREEASAMMCV